MQSRAGRWRTGPVRLQQLLYVAAPAQRERPGRHRPAAQASQLHPQPRPRRPPTRRVLSLDWGPTGQRHRPRSLIHSRVPGGHLLGSTAQGAQAMRPQQ